MSALTETIAAGAEAIPGVGGGVELAHAGINAAEVVGNVLKGDFRAAGADLVAGGIRAFGGTIDLGDGPLSALVGPGTELLAQFAHNEIANKKEATPGSTGKEPSILKEVGGTAVKAALADIPVLGRAFQGIEAVDTAVHGVNELLHGNFARGGADFLKTYIRGKAAISGQGAVQAELICGVINVGEDRIPLLQEKTAKTAQRAGDAVQGSNFQHAQAPQFQTTSVNDLAQRFGIGIPGQEQAQAA